MDLNDLFMNGGGIFVLLLTLIQIVPIQINPWSWLAKVVGKAINEDVIKELGRVKEHLDSLEENDKRQDEERGRDKALEARRRILEFGDDCRRGVKHSKEHFDSIFEDINAYRRYCREHPDFENDKAVLTIRGLEEIYHKCIQDNDFL